MDFDITNIDNRQLWYLFQEGNRDAFGELYRRFSPLLFKYGTRITNDRNVINDTIQDFYTELWKKKEFLNPSAIKNYMIVGFRRTLQRRISSRAYQASQSKQDILYNPDLLSTTSREEQLINDQVLLDRKKFLKKAIESLSPRQREIIFLKFYEKKSYEEISNIMGMQTGGVYTLMQKSIVRLKKHLNKSPLDISALFIFLFLLLL